VSAQAHRFTIGLITVALLYLVECEKPGELQGKLRPIIRMSRFVAKLTQR
jgi:hypothetical protein